MSKLGLSKGNKRQDIGKTRSYHHAPMSQQGWGAEEGEGQGPDYENLGFLVNSKTPSSSSFPSASQGTRPEGYILLTSPPPANQTSSSQGHEPEDIYDDVVPNPSPPSLPPPRSTHPPTPSRSPPARHTPLSPARSRSPPPSRSSPARHTPLPPACSPPPRLKIHSRPSVDSMDDDIIVTAPPPPAPSQQEVEEIYEDTESWKVGVEEIYDTSISSQPASSDFAHGTEEDSEVYSEIDSTMMNPPPSAKIQQLPSASWTTNEDSKIYSGVDSSMLHPPAPPPAHGSQEMEEEGEVYRDPASTLSTEPPKIHQLTNQKEEKGRKLSNLQMETVAEEADYVNVDPDDLYDAELSDPDSMGSGNDFDESLLSLSVRQQQQQGQEGGQARASLHFTGNSPLDSEDYDGNIMILEPPPSLSSSGPHPHVTQGAHVNGGGSYSATPPPSVPAHSSSGARLAGRGGGPNFRPSLPSNASISSNLSLDSDLLPPSRHARLSSSGSDVFAPETPPPSTSAQDHTYANLQSGSGSNSNSPPGGRKSSGHSPKLSRNPRQSRRRSGMKAKSTSSSSPFAQRKASEGGVAGGLAGGHHQEVHHKRSAPSIVDSACLPQSRPHPHMRVGKRHSEPYASGSLAISIRDMPLPPLPTEREEDGDVHDYDYADPDRNIGMRPKGRGTAQPYTPPISRQGQNQLLEKLIKRVGLSPDHKSPSGQGCVSAPPARWGSLENLLDQVPAPPIKSGRSQEKLSDKAPVPIRRGRSQENLLDGVPAPPTSALPTRGRSQESLLEEAPPLPVKRRSRDNLLGGVAGQGARGNKTGNEPNWISQRPPALPPTILSRDRPPAPLPPEATPTQTQLPASPGGRGVSVRQTGSSPPPRHSPLARTGRPPVPVHPGSVPPPNPPPVHPGSAPPPPPPPPQVGRASMATTSGQQRQQREPTPPTSSVPQPFTDSAPSSLLTGISNVQLRKSSEPSRPSSNRPPPTSNAPGNLMSEMQRFRLRNSKAEHNRGRSSADTVQNPSPPQIRAFQHVRLRPATSLPLAGDETDTRPPPHPPPVQPRQGRVPPPKPPRPSEFGGEGSGVVNGDGDKVPEWKRELQQRKQKLAAAKSFDGLSSDAGAAVSEQEMPLWKRELIESRRKISRQMHAQEQRLA